MVEIYADGIPCDADYINKLIDKYGITGSTCNPSLAKKYLPMSYYEYSKFIIDNFRGLPVSVQVLSSHLKEMEAQANIISGWGDNVYVKIPIVNEFGKSCANLIIKLLNKGIKVNVTAIFTEDQVKDLISKGLRSHHDCVLSVFSGRIADTLINPNDIIKEIRFLIGHKSKVKILWAGTRSMGDVLSADQHCDIITIPQAILDKSDFKGKDLNEYCLETVKMFANDSKNFTL
jgi:transaldolase